MKRHKIIICVAILVILGIGGYFLFKNGTQKIKFQTEKVTTGDIRSMVTATGTVNPVKTILVGTQVSGTISKILVDYNSIVRKGQLLAQIDPAILGAQVEQAKANLLSARSNMDKAKASYEDAKRNMERNRSLLAKNLIAISDLDTSETNFISAQAQWNASKAQVEQAKAALKLAERNLQYTNILSPVNGMVISKNVDIGQTVAASFQTPTLFTIAEDLTRMQIDTSVDEADIGKIEINQPVEFTVDAYPDGTFKGKVSMIRNAPTTVQNVVTYDVIVNVDNPELKLKPGMTANVSIVTAIRKAVLRVPNAALRFKLQNNEAASLAKKGPSAWIMINNKPKWVKVVPGISDGNYTEITDSNLKEGMDVIVDTTGEATKNSMVSRPGFFH
jgi:HlyD family secretion protein